WAAGDGANIAVGLSGPELQNEPERAFDPIWNLAGQAASLHLDRLEVGWELHSFWIDRGGEEALAALVPRDQSPQLRAPLERKIQEARTECSAGLETCSLQQIDQCTEIGLVADACGLVLNLALHAALMSQSPAPDGLYAVRRALPNRPGGRVSPREFVAA